MNRNPSTHRAGVAAWLLCLLLSCVLVHAEEEDAPLSPEGAAKVALHLTRARATGMLRRHAAKDEPDPWRVTEVLCALREFETAQAFARAAPRKDVAALPRYVQARRGRDTAAAQRALAEARAALAAGEVERALAALDVAAKEAKDVPSILAAYGRGELLDAVGRSKESGAAFAATANAAQELGWLRLASSALHRMGHEAYACGDLRPALAAWNRQLALEKERESTVGIGKVLANTALVYKARGNYPRAIARSREALKALEDVGDATGVAMTLANIGTMYRGLGDYPSALANQERAQRMLASHAQAKGGTDTPEGRRLSGAAAQALANLGNLYADLGNADRALEAMDEAGKIFERVGATHSAIRNTVGITAVLRAQGDHASALTLLEAIRTEAKTLDDAALMISILVNIGDVQGDLGKTAASYATYEEALDRARAINDRERTARMLVKFGIANATAGRRKKAIALLAEALREAERLRAERILVSALTALAWVHGAQGDARLALAAAKRAARSVELLVRGQGEEGGAKARAQYTDLYAVGALAAADLDDAAELNSFLETGRAGALLESLEGRDAMRSAQLPEALMEEELRARLALQKAIDGYAQTRSKGSLKETRAARQGVDDARQALLTVTERIRRQEKALAGLFYPRAATVKEIRAALRPEEALVSYGLFSTVSLALVLTPTDQRIVQLGPTPDLDARCRALDPSQPDAEPKAAIQALRQAVIEPLALNAKVKLLLVSPSGALSYVPFTLLVEDREVVYVPSASTHILLLDEATPSGRGVLALGDPDYKTHRDVGSLAVYASGSPLMPLPATREEAKRIGDVVLLGDKATATELRRALPQRPHWRAVHLACHCLIDAERPMLSGLALTANEHDPGFLTVSDVFRMKVRADLAALSACETGRGEILLAEGIVGLTRAFMYAGCPRVLCSLWKVPDEATAALMVKFYELWGKDHTAAAALKAAQAHVRGQPRWRHPYYWAAWVLWGLP